MKKGKVFTKGQVAVFLMVAALAVAVWLNVKYSGNDKFLGQATFVGKTGTSSTKAVKTSAKAGTADYFENAKSERDAAVEKASENVKDVLRTANVTESEKQAALSKLDLLSNRIATAQNIETLLCAKGFKDAVAIIGDSEINIVVKGDKLTDTQTLQIQDIVLSNTDFTLEKVKIVSFK